MQLSKNFTLIELITSQEAARRGLDNTPTPQVITNLTNLVKNVLQPLRDLVGKPIVISSGYRSPAVNAAIGGAKNSEHMTGCAADFTIPSKTNKETAEILRISKRCAEAHRQNLHDKLSGHFLCIKPRIVSLR